MSNIGSKSKSFGKDLNIVISNGTEEQFNKLATEGTALQSKNSMIISIPQENGKDKIDSVSLWLTDDDGQLLEISKPISSYNTLDINAINEIKNNIVNNAQTELMSKIESLNVSDLKAEFQSILDNEKNNIEKELKNYINIDATITREVQSANDKINSINKKLDQDINKIIWNCPNVAYLAHIVRILCEKHDMTYEFDNEYSESEVLHSEHHELIQRVQELENKIEQLSH